MKQLFLGLMMFMPFLGLGQDAIKSNKRKAELMGLVKDLYGSQVNVSFDITSKDLLSTFKDMSDGENYDKAFFNDLLEKMGSDTLNPLHLNNIADYYSKNKKYELANLYYLKAFKNLDIKYFNDDSASYYSLRGVLKANLNDSTALNDFDRSVELNPNDSISMYFYPLILISSRKYQKVRDLAKAQLERNADNVSYFYLYLVIAEVFENIQSVFDSIGEDVSMKKEYVKKNYNELVDYALLDKYFKKYKSNSEIVNCRVMADLFGLIYKIVAFEQDSNYRFVFEYSDFEKNKLREIITKLNELQKRKKLNEFTANRCLGYAYFMLEEWDRSIDHFKNAIQIFPVEKKDVYFNLDACYDAIAVVHFQKMDTINYRKSLNNKIKVEENKEETIEELTELAFDYFRCDDIVKAEEYCNKIKNINSENFDALRLLSHINFLNGFSSFAQFYGESAGRCVNNDSDNCNLLLQLSIYQVYNGDLDAAINNIEIARKIQGNGNCLLCDKLMKIIEDSK